MPLFRKSDSSPAPAATAPPAAAPLAPAAPPAPPATPHPTSPVTPGPTAPSAAPTAYVAPAPGNARIAARTHELVKVYGTGQTQVVALDRVSLDVYAGEFTAIMGPSGSGKSTLMHCLAGLDGITAGQVLVGGVDLRSLSDKQLTALRRDKVGFVFQAFNLIPTLTAQENILLPLSIAGRKPEQDWYDTVIEATGLRDRLTHKPNELSGGQQQRVACARALVSRPDIVFADEPTGNLDSRSGAEVLGFLRHSVDRFGQTIVMVTHDATAAGYTDRVVFLADGHVVSELRHPTPAKVLEMMSGLDRAAEAAHAPRAAVPPAGASTAGTSVTSAGA